MSIAAEMIAPHWGGAGAAADRAARSTRPQPAADSTPARPIVRRRVRPPVGQVVPVRVTGPVRPRLRLPFRPGEGRMRCHLRPRAAGLCVAVRPDSTPGRDTRAVVAWVTPSGATTLPGRSRTTRYGRALWSSSTMSGTRRTAHRRPPGGRLRPPARRPGGGGAAVPPAPPLRLSKFHAPEIVFGPGSLPEAAHAAVRLGARRPFVVTDPGLLEAGLARRADRPTCARPGLRPRSGTTSRPTPRITRSRPGYERYREGGLRRRARHRRRLGDRRREGHRAARGQRRGHPRLRGHRPDRAPRSHR